MSNPEYAPHSPSQDNQNPHSYSKSPLRLGLPFNSKSGFKALGIIAICVFFCTIVIFWVLKQKEDISQNFIRKIATISDEHITGIENLIFSSDGKQYAYLTKDNKGKKVFVINGEINEGDNGVEFYSDPVLGPDKKEILYEIANKEATVQDPKIISIREHTVAPNGKSSAKVIALKDPDREKRIYEFYEQAFKEGFTGHIFEDSLYSKTVEVNGKRGKLYGFASKPIFSPDSTKFAYSAAEDRQNYLVTNNQELPTNGSAYNLVFSPDSEKLMYALQEDNMANKNYIVIDGQKQSGLYKRVEDLLFSPDGRSIAFIAEEEPLNNNYTYEFLRHFVVVNGREGKRYNSIGRPVFSPDSNRVAYVAWQKDKAATVVVDDREDNVFYSDLNMSTGTSYLKSLEQGIYTDYISVQQSNPSLLAFSLTFSPDSQKIAYVGNLEYDIVSRYDIVSYSDDTRTPASFGFVVVNNKAERLYGFVSQPVFSPNSKILAYKAKYIDDLFRPFLKYSKDYKQIAFRDTDLDKTFVVTSNREGKGYDDIGDLFFSPDGSKIMYGARLGNELFWIEQPLD